MFAMIEKEVVIANKLGLHARAASKLVKLASGFAAEIELAYEEQNADAKSIMQVLVLGAGIGSRLTLRVCGSDEQAATEAVCGLIEDFFGEGE